MAMHTRPRRFTRKIWWRVSFPGAPNKRQRTRIEVFGIFQMCHVVCEAISVQLQTERRMGTLDVGPSCLPFVGVSIVKAFVLVFTRLGVGGEKK